MTRNCRCGGKLVMRRKRTFDRETVIWACEDCHRGAGAVGRRDVNELSYEELRDMPRATVVRKRQPNSKRRTYDAALKSAHWKQLREEVLRARPRCERKHAGCTGTATELNHRHYRTLGSEVPADVEAVCHSCQMTEREQRIARSVLG